MMIVSTPLYFRQRNRIWRSLFLNIIHKLSETSFYFTERHDAIGRISLTLLQKCTAVLRQLADDMIADMIYEYLKLAKSNVLKCQEYYSASNSQEKVVWISQYVREH
jgi:hypothetical protein